MKHKEPQAPFKGAGCIKKEAPPVRNTHVMHKTAPLCTMYDTERMCI
ncbi:hypothetical protein C2W63_02186 [Bacillus velezensis]|nr:hypothetical protein C2W63_02186 [Bacillus velezensis]